MVWAQIALLAIKLLLELPALQEWLERIFGALSRARPLQAAKESGKVLKALEAKYEECQKGVFTATGICPVEELVKKLEEKYGAA